MDSSFKEYVILWAIYAMHMESDLGLDGGMWDLYYSIPTEEIESILKELQTKELVSLKSTRTDNRIHPMLALTKKGKRFLSRQVQYFDNSSTQIVDIYKLDDILNSIITFFKLCEQCREKKMNLFDLMSNSAIKPHERQYIIRYLHMYGDILIMCRNDQYLKKICIENKRYFRGFLGKLPEIESAIFRHSYKVYDPFYKDILDIVEYYVLEDEEIDLYRRNTLSRYYSSKWYEKCIWVRRVADCFLKLSKKPRFKDVVVLM